MLIPTGYSILSALGCWLFLYQCTICFSQENQHVASSLFPSPVVAEQKLAIVLRIPHTVIAKAVNQDFQHTSPVEREIMGTRSRGTAHCQGKVTCELVEHSKGALVLCKIAGQVQSETCGINGPALISAHAVTCYEAKKFAFFDGHHFTTSPASLRSFTKVSITGIGSILPGLRGRIVRRVAEKRATESHDKAEAITARLTADELRQRIDTDFDERIRTLNEKLQSYLSILEHLQITGKKVCIRSSKECVEVGVLKKEIEENRSSDQPRRRASDSIELWIQFGEGIVFEALTISQLINLGPTSITDLFSKHPRLSKLDQKVAIEFTDGWVILKLND